MISNQQKRRHQHAYMQSGRGQASRARSITAARDYVAAYKARIGCADCDEHDPVVLDFDHRDGEKKLFNIGGNHNCGINKLKAEIAKCDVRCANCHRRKTWLARIMAAI